MSPLINAALLALCLLVGAERAAAAGASAANPLKLAVADVPHTAPVLIAEALGYFAAEGLAVQVQHHPLGRVCLERLLAGEAHVATVADVPIMFASFARRDFNILASIAQSGRENLLVVRQDRGIATPADLRGKRIGIPAGTSVHYFVDTLLLFHGLQPTDVTEVKLDPADPTGPLVRGDVDAAGLFGPQISQALHGLGANARTLAGPGFFGMSFNLVSLSSGADVSDADAARLLRAVERGQQLLRDDPARARLIVAKALKVHPDALVKSWDDYDFRVHLSQPLITGLESQARWALRSGLVPAGSPMPDYLSLVRPQPLTQVNPRAVRIIGR